MLRARAIVTGQVQSSSASDTVRLTYDQRYRRRIRMQSEGGTEFLLDLPEARALKDGDVLQLDDATLVTVAAAPEAVMRITAADAVDLTRLAWHIGNRHLAAEIRSDCLLIAEDHVIAEMVQGLGGTVSHESLPFQPEGGAYDHGH